MKKFSSTVAGASLIIIFFGLISKGLGFVREIVFAGSFGLSHDFDIYLVGSVFPIIINTGIVYLGQNFFIPSYNKVKSENGSTEIFFNSFLWIFAVGGIAIAVLLYLFADKIIGMYLINSAFETRAIASSIFKIFIFTIPINAAISIIIAFLQAEFEFKTPAISQLWVNLSIIILTLIFSGRVNVYIIPAGFLTGMLLQLIYLIPKTRKHVKFMFPRPAGMNKLMSVTYSTLIITIFIEVISQLYMVADRFFIKSVDTGGIAALNYAQILFMLPVSIFSIALSTAIFPKLAQKYYSKNIEDLHDNLISGMNINVFISIPLMLLFGYFGSYLISLFYQNGNFNYKDTITTFAVLRILSLSLVFYSLYSILNKLIYGIGSLKFLFFITIIGIGIKFFLNFMLVGHFKQDGLAMSTSITYVYFFISSVIFVKIKFKDLNLGKFVGDSIISVLNCILTFLLVKILWNSLGAVNLISATLLILLFISVYTINSYLLKQKPFLILKTAYSNFIVGYRK